VFCYFSFIVAK